MEFRRFKSVNDESTDWAIVGERGAVHFWKFNTYPRLGGVEEHRKEPGEYNSGAPSQEHCFILGCPCWHDGSSLYADKFFPILENEGEEAVYAKLEDEYRDRFETQ